MSTPLKNNANRIVYAEAVGVAKVIICDFLLELKNLDLDMEDLKSLISKNPGAIAEILSENKSDFDELGLINDWELVTEVITNYFIFGAF